MGTGISAVCGSKRSIHITNSVRKLPTIREDEVDSDFENEADLDIDPSSGKLHPAESRDSGIGENDIPHGYKLNRQNGSGFLNSSTDSSPEKNNNILNDEDKNERVSRPHSCRLGHRGHKGKRGGTPKHSQNADLTDSQIKRFVLSAKTKQTHDDVIITDSSIADLSDDTLSLNSHGSASPERRTNARPKSAHRRRNERNSDGNRSRHRDNSQRTRVVNDLDSSTDTEISDTDMLSIPDETGQFTGKGGHKTQSRDTNPQRRGWVKNEDFTDVMISTSVTPRVGGPTDMYRIVSGTYSDIDVNLAKKASERSISSIILTPMDGQSTPTNECFDPPVECCDHCPCAGSLDELVDTLMTSVHRLWSRDLCTPTDFEGVVKGLRYQLVSMALGNTCQRSSPRIEVKGEQTNIFSDEAWRVQIRLRTEDEEIIETSEKTLGQRLASKGKKLLREDISILLAEHLKTIEKLQQVTSEGKLHVRHEAGDCPPPRRCANRNLSGSGEHSRLLAKRPGSASKLRKLNNNQPEVSTSTTVTESTTDIITSGSTGRQVQLPPIDKSRAGLPRGVLKHKIKAIPVNRKDNSNLTEDQTETVTSLGNQSATIKSDEKENTDLTAIEEEDALLFADLIEAFRVLWDRVTSQLISHLLQEYRRREEVLILAVIEHTSRQTRTYDTTESENRRQTDSKSDSVGVAPSMGQQPSVPESLRVKSEQGIRTLDEEFVRSYEDRSASGDVTMDVFIDALTDHMKQTRLIRVQSYNARVDHEDWNGNQRSNSFTGFGNGSNQNNSPQPTNTLKRQHSFSGTPSISRQNSFDRSCTRQNSFLRSLPGSRQNSYVRTRSRGSTGTYSTTSSGISSAVSSDHSDGTGSSASKSALSRELSYGLLTEFEDIAEQDEEAKTARENNSASRPNSDCLKPPSGRRSTGSRATSGQQRDRERRRGQTQVHGLGLAPTETPHAPLRKIEEDALPKVEESESKVVVRSRPDSGIAVSTSSASYSSSELHKERDLEEPNNTISCQEMLDTVSKVLPDHHNDLKSLVAAVTKGLNSQHSKAQALYCWLSSQTLEPTDKSHRKSNSPSGRLKQLHDKKISYWSFYMDMLKIAGLKCEKVEGYVKSDDYLPGNTVQTPKFQHSWVAVSVDGHYRLVDPKYGAIGKKFFLQHYFATSPDELLLSHFPKDKKWLLMNQPAAIEGFEGTLKTWPAMFHFNIRPLNMKSVIRTYDGKLSITVLLQNVAVNPQLEYAGPGEEIESDLLEEKIDHEIRDVDNAETYHVTLPQEGNYYFTVYAHVLEECVDVPVFQYRIEYVDELL